MSAFRGRGSYFGPRPAGPSTSAASGWWSAASQFLYQRDGTWPTSLDAGSIAGLALWLRADDAVLSGSNVSTWPDRSGRGFTATVFSGTPTYGATDMNGHPAVKFNGSSSMLIDADVHAFSLTESVTMFAAVKGPALGTVLLARRPVMCGGTVGGNFATCMSFRTYGGSQNYGGMFTRVLVSDANMESSTAVSDVRKILTNSYDGSTGRFYLNGTQAATVSNVPTALSGAVKGNGRVSLGAQISGASAECHTVIDIAEVVIYSKLLSDSERTIVTNYLTDRYAPQ